MGWSCQPPMQEARGEEDSSPGLLHKDPLPQASLPASLRPHALEASCPSCLPHIDKEAENGQAVGAPCGSTEIPIEFLVEVN